MPRTTGQPRRRLSSSSSGNHLPPSPSSSSSRRGTPSQTPRRPLPKRTTRPVNALKRCSSAPGSLSTIAGVEGDDESSARGDVARSLTFNQGLQLFRGHTCTDILSPSTPCSPEGYSKDAKVVVNVTVEGSPGPIRTMIRLGCSVEDTIVAVVDRYDKEGRSPKLDRDAVASYELHHSYFSLESLGKSEPIGSIGSRTFYLRTSCNNSVDPPPPVIPPLFMISTCIARKLAKIARRARRLWKVVICSR